MGPGNKQEEIMECYIISWVNSSNVITEKYNFINQGFLIQVQIINQATTCKETNYRL